MAALVDNISEEVIWTEEFAPVISEAAAASAAFFAEVTVWPILGAGVLTGAGLLGWGLSHLFKRDGNVTVPAIVWFHHHNFTKGNVDVMNNMRREFDGKHVFDQHVFTLGEVGGGMAHGNLTVQMSPHGIPSFAEGKWIAVDTTEGSHAEQKTIESFEKLLASFKEKGEEAAVEVLEWLADAAPAVADEMAAASHSAAKWVKELEKAGSAGVKKNEV